MSAEHAGGFTGRIGRTLAESEPSWPPPAHPGEHAPNVLVVLLDDLGFSHLGCYGSDLPTPNIDRLADRGLRYSNFHVTALCSPTRAALLTGRNHHTVGMRAISNFSTGFPHMRGRISDEAATMAEVLRGAGYATLMVGKWHLGDAPEFRPTEHGFDEYFGLPYSNDMWPLHPDLVRLPKDAAERKRRWLRRRRSRRPAPSAPWRASPRPGPGSKTSHRA